MNIAMISKWHVHAGEYANALSGAPGCRVTAVWDEDAQAGQAWAEELGCRFVPELDDVLCDPDIHAVSIVSATSKHTDIIVRAARAKKAIFTEKVLALTTEDALRIKAAVEQNQVPFAISYPHKTNPELIEARRLMLEGKLGQVNYARVRNVHDGSIAGWLPDHFYDPEACGGGAMIDLGAHPMYTLCWLLGRPERVLSMFTEVTGRGVEDNAVCVLGFPGGAIGVSETGFVSGGNPYTLELSGTKGSLMIHNGLRYCCEDTGMKWVEVTTLPEAPKLPVLQWAEAVQTGAPLPEFDIDQAVVLTEIMQAAYTAHREGRITAV